MKIFDGDVDVSTNSSVALPQMVGGHSCLPFAGNSFKFVNGADIDVAEVI